MKAPFYPKTP